MAESKTGDQSERCIALTEGGERCSRPAQSDGFCYQHDESAETIDEVEADGSADEDEADAGPNGEAAEPDESDHEGSDTDMSQTETEQADEQSAGDGESESDQREVEAEEIDLWDARDTAQQVAEELIDDPFDGIVEISQDEDDWRVVLEVIERRAIPDTQDILGRYDVTVSSSGELRGYRLTGRYRRGDVSDEQTPEY
jgi:hypothetical protein